RGVVAPGTDARRRAEDDRGARAGGAEGPSGAQVHRRAGARDASRGSYLRRRRRLDADRRARLRAPGAAREADRSAGSGDRPPGTGTGSERAEGERRGPEHGRNPRVGPRDRRDGRRRRDRGTTAAPASDRSGHGTIVVWRGPRVRGDGEAADHQPRVYAVPACVQWSTQERASPGGGEGDADGSMDGGSRPCAAGAGAHPRPRVPAGGGRPAQAAEGDAARPHAVPEPLGGTSRMTGLPEPGTPAGGFRPPITHASASPRSEDEGRGAPGATRSHAQEVTRRSPASTARMARTRPCRTRSERYPSAAMGGPGPAGRTLRLGSS